MSNDDSEEIWKKLGLLYLTTYHVPILILPNSTQPTWCCLFEAINEPRNRADLQKQRTGCTYLSVVTASRFHHVKDSSKSTNSTSNEKVSKKHFVIQQLVFCQPTFWKFARANKYLL